MRAHSGGRDRGRFRNLALPMHTRLSIRRAHLGRSASALAATGLVLASGFDDLLSGGRRSSDVGPMGRQEVGDLRRGLLRRPRVLAGHEVAVDHGVGDERQSGYLVERAPSDFLWSGPAVFSGSAILVTWRRCHSWRRPG